MAKQAAATPPFNSNARVRCLRFSRLCALAVLTPALVGVASAATVEFKLNPSLKGHEQRAAARLVSAAGLASPTRGANGIYSVVVTDDAQALRVATGLRENASVLWAKSAAVEKALARAIPDTEYHARMLAITVNEPDNAEATVARLSAKTGQALKIKRMSNGNRALVVLPVGTTAASLAAVAVAATADSGVKSAERIAIARHQWIPNDTMWSQQWSLGTGAGGIRAAAAWDGTPSGSIAVAVIDTGIRSHPDLDAKRVTGFDMISETWIANDEDGRDADASDPGDTDFGTGECQNPFDLGSSWHGTHVAGIIAATSNNGEGIAGVAPNARIVPVRALGRCGGTFDDVADSIRWAAGVPVAGTPTNPNPAKVLNLSLGGTAPCSANMQSAVDAAIARGAVVVVSAGNEAGLASTSAPANCNGVVSVAASNLLGDLSSYSNFGSSVTLTAPGGDSGDLPGVISTLNGGVTLPGAPSYATYAGTSMAAPHVAGVVALMLARDPSLTPGQVLNRLQGSARAFPVGTDCSAAVGACGSGLLDAANAVQGVTSTRSAGDVSASTDRMRIVELQNNLTGRFALIADPVELAQMLSGQRGGSWSRTGYSTDAFSFTAHNNALSLSQPVCRARLVEGGGYTYSATAQECKDFAANSGWNVDGMVFAAAFPNGTHCPVGSTAAYEYVRLDASGYNLRTMWDTLVDTDMVAAGWTRARVAFCLPQ